MGITGPAGLFQKSCEETLGLLRKESSILLTILKVLKFDPLHSWTISPLKLHKIQRDESIENEMFIDGSAKTSETSKPDDEADHAVFGVEKKLSSLLAVECHVQELINEATDKRNLCRMYPGWQPWL